MATIELNGFDELIKKLDKLGNQSYVEEIGKKAVSEAAPIAEAAMRGSISSVEYGPYSTKSISGSIQTTEARINTYGAYAVARPTGRDAKGVRNAEKAAYLQYGTSRMPARPWRERAVASSQGAAVKAMEEVIKTEMELD